MRCVSEVCLHSLPCPPDPVLSRRARLSSWTSSAQHTPVDYKFNEHILNFLEVISNRCNVAGTINFSVEEVVLACRSLQRIAEQVQDTEESGRCFHDIIIPRLLSVALQAALQGDGKDNITAMCWYLLYATIASDITLVHVS